MGIINVAVSLSSPRRADLRTGGGHGFRQCPAQSLCAFPNAWEFSSTCRSWNTAR